MVTKQNPASQSSLARKELSCYRNRTEVRPQWNFPRRGLSGANAVYFFDLEIFFSIPQVKEINHFLKRRTEKEDV